MQHLYLSINIRQYVEHVKTKTQHQHNIKAMTQANKSMKAVMEFYFILFAPTAQSAQVSFTLLKLEILHLHCPMLYKSTGWLPVPSYSTPFKSDGNMRWTSVCLYKGPKITCSNIPKSVPDLEKGWIVKYWMGFTSSYHIHFLQQMVLQHFKIQLHWLLIHPA